MRLFPTLIRSEVMIALCAAALLAAIFAGRCAGQSEIQSIRRQVAVPDSFAATTAKPEKEEEERDDHYRHRKKKSGFVSFFANSDCDDDDDDGNGLFSFAATAAGAVVTSPFWGPHCMLETDAAALQGPLRFSAWPFANDSFGAMTPWDYDPELEKNWLARTSFEFLDAEGGELNALGGRVLLDSVSRFGLDTSFHNWREELPAGGVTDSWIGDVNLVYRFAQSQSTQFRAGVGVNWLHDSVTTGAGFNLTYGVDLFPLKPLHVAAEIDWGGLGHTHLFHGRVTTGLILRNFEIYTGYDYLSVGQPEFHSLIVGTSIWF